MTQPQQPSTPHTHAQEEVRIRLVEAFAAELKDSDIDELTRSEMASDQADIAMRVIESLPRSETPTQDDDAQQHWERAFYQRLREFQNAAYCEGRAMGAGSAAGYKPYHEWQDDTRVARAALVKAVIARGVAPVSADEPPQEPEYLGDLNEQAEAEEQRNHEELLRRHVAGPSAAEPTQTISRTPFVPTNPITKELQNVGNNGSENRSLGNSSPAVRGVVDHSRETIQREVAPESNSAVSQKVRRCIHGKIWGRDCGLCDLTKPVEDLGPSAAESEQPTEGAGDRCFKCGELRFDHWKAGGVLYCDDDATREADFAGPSNAEVIASLRSSLEVAQRNEERLAMGAAELATRHMRTIADLEAARKALKETLALLREMEWESNAYLDDATGTRCEVITINHCFFCEGREPSMAQHPREGHTPDCRLARALGDKQTPAPPTFGDPSQPDNTEHAE